MHRKTLPLTAGLLGGLLLAGSANAQTAHPNHVASANCPPGCVPASSCVTQRPLTQAQREAIKRRRERLAQERADREQAEHDRIAQEQAQIARDQANREALAREQAERDRLARETQAALDRKRAEADRLAQEERERAALAVPVVTTHVARGGGPARFAPHLTLGVETGAGGLTEEAHNTSYPGPMWGARIGVDFTNWIGLEGRWNEMYNEGYTPNVGDHTGLFTNMFSGVMRLSLPTRYIRPYLLGGMGVYYTTPVGSGSNPQQTSLRSNTSLAIPMGGGLDLIFSHHWGFGFEGVYHYLVDGQFSTDPALSRGDMWTVSGILHVSM